MLKLYEIMAYNKFNLKEDIINIIKEFISKNKFIIGKSHANFYI